MKSKAVFKTKYEGIRDDLIKEILRRKKGDILPSEVALAATYKVNRGTVNKVLSSIQSEGLIGRKPKVGSIVTGKSNNTANLKQKTGIILELTTGHLYEDFFRLIAHEIQINNILPIHLDLALSIRDKRFKENFSGYFDELLDSNHEFVVIDGIQDLPYETIRERLPKIRNLIFINRLESAIQFPATRILSDYEKGGYIAARKLLSLGHKKLLIVSHSPCTADYVMSSMILKGVRRALRESGSALDFHTFITYTPIDDFRGKIEDLFDRKDRPTAVFAFADVIARRIQYILAPEGINAGRDFHLIGYFDTPHATDMFPSMTSVSINQDKIASIFGKLLGKGTFREELIKVEPVIIDRATTM